ncbi:ATP synthase subunit I [Paenibacillus turpanensis]|uniref:ATP synthase subunit I n=1 Tax=Paenibacillus turpanensis TaxID=2689078 RepID=UPI00140B9DC1|nr:ATP synthase subunit I [Paenibacillus turpanensis]
MTEISVYLKTVYRIALVFAACCFAVWAVFPELRGIAAGLVVGIVASLINAWFLASKVRYVTEQALQQGRRRVNFGFLTRAAVAVLAVLFALKTEGITIYAVIAGLFFSPLATLLLGVVFNKKGK